MDAKLLAALDASATEMKMAVPRFIGLFCGDPGIGKTVFAAHLAQVITPPDKKIIHLDTSDGWTSLLNHPQLMNRVEHVEFSGFLSQIDVLVEAIRTNYGRFANTGTIILDELSSIAGDNLHFVAARREINTEKRNKLEQGEIDQRDYGTSGNLVKQHVLIPFRTIQGLNIISTAHSKEIGKDNETKKTIPAFPQDVFREISRIQQITGLMTGEVKKLPQGDTYVRKIQVHPDIQGPKCKSRVGGLDVINKPNDVVARIKEWMDNGGVTEEQTEEIKVEENKEFNGFITE